MLWFDVGIKRYTTSRRMKRKSVGCGLMQESKDIQQFQHKVRGGKRCGLMQESKDIQPDNIDAAAYLVVV